MGERVSLFPKIGAEPRATGRLAPSGPSELRHMASETGWVRMSVVALGVVGSLGLCGRLFCPQTGDIVYKMPIARFTHGVLCALHDGIKTV